MLTVLWECLYDISVWNSLHLVVTQINTRWNLPQVIRKMLTFLCEYIYKKRETDTMETSSGRFQECIDRGGEQVETI